MLLIKSYSFSLLFLLSCHLFYGQEEFPNVLSPAADPCGCYSKENNPNKRPVPYPALREADVAWEKRVWREIDLREKQNQMYYYPVEIIRCRTSLIQTLTRNILNGTIIAFQDEEFLMPYEKNAIRKKLVHTDTVMQFSVDAEGNEKEMPIAVTDSTSIYSRVLKFRLKEDWFFDKQRSNLEVRIIGLAAYEYDEDKEAFRELFWVYFPACRQLFANTDVFNSRNDKESRTLDEVFMKRMFSSVVIKESNVYDRYIEEYAKGTDALLESDAIKMDLFNWEHDLWQY